MTIQQIKKVSDWVEIKKILNYCSSHDLINLIFELYSLSSSNKQFIKARFLSHNHSLECYKAQIKKYLAPNEPWKPSQSTAIKEAKKVLSLYNKATRNIMGLTELMVYYVECGTDFLCRIGDMDEAYYASLESVFSSILKNLKHLDQEQQVYWLNRLTTIVKKADDLGWGYYDVISQMLANFYQFD